MEVFGLTQLLSCFLCTWQQQSVGGRECKCQEGKTLLDIKMPQACAITSHISVPHSCWMGYRVLPGPAVPEGNKEGFWHLCRKTDDLKMKGLAWEATELVSLAAPTWILPVVGFTVRQQLGLREWTRNLPEGKSNFSCKALTVSVTVSNWYHAIWWAGWAAVSDPLSHEKVPSWLSCCALLWALLLFCNTHVLWLQRMFSVFHNLKFTSNLGELACAYLWCWWTFHSDEKYSVSLPCLRTI